MLRGWAATGAPGRIRTADASLRTAALYPLSYGGPGSSYPTSEDVPPRLAERDGTDLRSTMTAVTTPLPDLVLYARPGCHLCAETRESIELLLADRTARGLPVPAFIERNIEEDPDLHRQLLERIPVVELGAGRLELATSVARLRRLLADVLDAPLAEASR